MPPENSTGAGKAVETIETPLDKGKGKNDAEANVEAQVKSVVKVQTVADIFPTFKIDGPPGALKPGLSIVLPLADGKVEIVNLDTICQNVLGSEEMAEYVKSNPERLAAMMVSQKEWLSAIAKCDIAVRVTSKS
jgi:hypothetical protein